IGVHVTEGVWCVTHMCDFTSFGVTMEVRESMVGRFRRLLEPLMPPSDGGSEERRLRWSVLLSGVLLLPIWTAIQAIEMAQMGFHQNGVVLLVTLAVLTLSCVWATYQAPNIRPWLRFTLAAMLVLVALNLWSGATLALWLVLFPSAIMFLLGVDEGQLWLLAVMTIVGMLPWIPEPWPMEGQARLVLVLVLVSAFAWIQERSRGTLLAMQVHEHERLEATLEELRSLEGLLPICASCKSIRDDQGFWTSIEHHLTTFHQAQVVASFCPKCTPSEEPKEGISAAAEMPQAQPSMEERRQQSRHTILSWIIVLLVLILLCFGAAHATHGNGSEAILLGVMVLYAMAFGVGMWLKVPTAWLVRVSAVVLMTVLSAALMMGGPFQYVFLWLYLLPPAYVYLLGHREGSLWSLGTALVALPVMLWSSSDYPLVLEVRFGLTLGLLGLSSLAQEWSREQVNAELMADNARLRDALTEVGILRGLLPVCTACKSVRDDQGYWTHVETYISEHSDIRFSHSICPRCFRELYPDLGDPEDEP
ncbi:MAG: hypothetical protein AAFX99_10690, partial [Myxococcota bacterium]